jgi:hypothetical protein
MRRIGIWSGIVALVVLAARSLAYQLAPTPTSLTISLQHQAGGPRLVVTIVAALGLAFGAAAAVLWLASTAVRERHAARSRGGSPPSLRLATTARTALVLFAATSLIFAVVESYVHWRAGLGVHGLQCLVGPEHRNALPLLAALSMVAASCHSALAHLLGWMRTTLALLVSRPRGVGRRPQVVRRPSAAPAVRPFLPGPRDPRGPPSFASV